MAAALVDAAARALGSTAPSRHARGAAAGRPAASTAPRSPPAPAWSARRSTPWCAATATTSRELVDLIAGPAGARRAAGGRRRRAARRGGVRLHARGRAAPRRRARAPHPAGASSRPDRGLAAAAPAAALMAEALGWAPDRAREETDAWRARVAARPRGGGRAGRRARTRRVPGGARRARASAGRGGAVSELVLGLDQGTSSTRCVVLDGDAARAAGRARSPSPRRSRGPGLVEQDPDELAALVRARARRRARRRRGAAAATWPRSASPTRRRRSSSGTAPRAAPIHPAIVWQDRRTDARVRRAGATHASARARAHRARARRHLPGHEAGLGARPRRRRPRRGRGRAARLRRRRRLAPAPPGRRPRDRRRQRRALAAVRARAGDWDDELLALFGVPRALLPPVVDSDAHRRRDRRRARVGPRPATSRRRCSGCAAGRPGRPR